MNNTIVTCLLLFWSFQLTAQLQSPNEFLPHKLGEQFTRHHQLVDYFEHVAENSDLVSLQDYGNTSQGRPLKLAFVTSKKNQKNLEKIRQHNLSLAGMASSKWKPNQPIGIIWFTYSVHGNEPSGAECSMQVLYDLIDPNNARTKTWLENTVVIIDPAANPDGYERYTHFYRNTGHMIPNPEMASREHQEPWPTGRVNHYLFDLNRDWAWLTQKESQQRLEIYSDWLPHVHPDVHEQYPNNPYYFAPAAEPFHEYITDWQRQFQTEIGKNHADYFDENGWLYFTREIFDLFYPSYGDTYPTFNGAIGMTYEQAGHGVGGVAVGLHNGDTLTLADRIEHHYTTSLSTIEMTSKNASRLTDNFRNYFDQSMNDPQGKYKAFFIKNNPSDAHKVKRFLELLDRHDIAYAEVGKSTSVNAYDYQNQTTGKVSLSENDIVIGSYQPKSVLAQVLLEPEPLLTDSLTYDITAWALPYAFGLEAYASTNRFRINLDNQPQETAPKPLADNLRPYALVAPWNSTNDAAFLGELMQQGVKARFSKQAFSNDSGAFAEGSLVMTRADNYQKDWVKITKAASAKYGIQLAAIQSGFSTTGKDLGSDQMQLLSQPKVAVLYGDNVNNHSYGFVWHYFESELNYPFTALKMSQLESGTFTNYNVLILPEGHYKLNDILLKKINEWVAGGGKLIAIGSANAKLADKEGFALKKPDSGVSPVRKATPYAQNDRSHISNGTPGAIVKLNMDATHPLAFGIGSSYYSLKTYTSKYPKLESGWNVGVVAPNVKKSGFIGSEYAKELPNTLSFGVENKGSGKIYYMIDDPLFRAFWYNGKLLFSNALFLD